MFTNGRGDLGSIPSRVIPKTQKMILDATLLNTQHYKVRVKWSNPGNGGGCPRGVMVKAMDCGIVVRKYPWERYEHPYPPNYGLNSTPTVLLGEWLWH